VEDFARNKITADGEAIEEEERKGREGDIMGM